MSVLPATGCCCATPECPAAYFCRVGEDWWEKTRAEYITVGRPRGPTAYPGKYWAAWHNGMSAASLLDLDLKLKVVKRTLVQTPCSIFPNCPSVHLPTNGVCTTTGFMSVNGGCHQTTYTDNFEWDLTSTLPLKGVNPRQTKIVTRDFNPHLQDFPSIKDPSTPDHLPEGKPYCSIPEGYYPCLIQGSCNVGTCVDANEATAFGASPSWWPGENRKLLPRFSGPSNVNATAVPSSSYPQVAACGAVSYQNRCTYTKTSTSEPTCLDFPIIVLPGHSGSMCDGTPTIPCGVLNKELGANDCIWGFDIHEPRLLAGITALGLPDGVYVGDASSIGTWVVKYTVDGSPKLRFFFNIESQIALQGQTFKFTSNEVVTEKAVGTRRFATTSWWIDVDFKFTPRKWCLHSPQCDCVQSYSENCPSVLNYEVAASLSDKCSTNDLTLELNVGLEEVKLGWWLSDIHHQLCTCGPSCIAGLCAIGGPATAWCWEWSNLPEGGFGVPEGATPAVPGGTKATIRFLGDEPIERGHPFWRRYRNQYNHTATVNDTWNHGLYDPPPFGTCNGGMFGNIVTFSKVYAEGVPPEPFENCCTPTPLIAGYAHHPSLCDPSCCFCSTPDNSGVGGCLACLPPGCYDVQPSWFEDCPPSNPWPSGTCGPTLISVDPSAGDPNAVIPCFAIELFRDCNPFHRCGLQFLQLCGSLSFTSCEIAGYAYSVSLPEVLVIEWDPRTSCSPVGTYTKVKVASRNTACEGPTSWLESKITVVVS